MVRSRPTRSGGSTGAALVLVPRYKMRFFSKSALLVFFALIFWTSVDCQDYDDWSEDVSPDLLFGGLPGPLSDLVNTVVPGVADIFTKAIQCAAEYLKNVNICSAESSLDPFAVVKECAEDTGFADLAEKFQEFLPKIELPFGVPESAQNARCFDPSSVLDLAGQAVKGVFG